MLFPCPVIVCEHKHVGPEMHSEGVYFVFHSPKVNNVAIEGRFNHWNIHRDGSTGADIRNYLLTSQSLHYETYKGKTLTQIVAIFLNNFFA